MTYKLWEETLLKYLKSLTSEERDEILGYYREIYNDKRDTGITEEDIIESFGDPMIAAAKILKEHSEDAESEDRTSLKDAPSEEAAQVPVDSEDKEKNDGLCEKCLPVLKKVKDKVGNAVKGISVSKVVGWFFLTLLVLIPLAAIVVSIIASLAAVTVSGAAMMLGGALVAIAAPITLAFGYSFSAMLILLGAAILLAGLGAFIFITFYYITKYVTVSCVKVIKYFVRRSK